MKADFVTWQSVQRTTVVLPDDTEAHIAFRTEGVGHRILLVHGWAHSSRIWTQAAALLRSTHTVVAFDWPGFGDSPPLPRESVSMDTYSCVLAGMIERVAKEGRIAAIAADSLGAIVLLRLLAEREIRAPVLILSGCPYFGLGRLATLTGETRLMAAFLTIVRRSPRSLARSIIRALSLATVNNWRHIDDDLVGSVLAADPYSSGRLLTEMKTVARVSRLSSNQSIHAVVVRGKMDRVASHAAGVALARDVVGQLIEIESVAHTPMMESPKRFAEVLLDAIRSGEPR